jgi:hypothetical protein
VTTALEDPPLRLSWSRIRNHDECPAKGELMRTSKPAMQDMRNFFHGNVVDLAMRRWLAQDPPQPGWMRAQVDVLFEESLKILREEDHGFVRWKNLSDRADTLAMCRDLVERLEVILQRYCLPFWWQSAVRFSVPLMIRGLNGEMRQIILVGEMDLLVRDSEERYAVWDLKATKNNDYYKKVLGQLAFYAIAVRAMKGKFPAMTGLMQPMCDQQVLPVTVDDDAVRQMAARIVKTAHDIWAGRLAPKESNDGCTGAYGCPVQHACPKFKMPAPPGRVILGASA